MSTPTPQPTPEAPEADAPADTSRGGHRAQSKMTRWALWCGALSWSIIPLIPALFGLAFGLRGLAQLRRGEIDASERNSLLLGLVMNLIAILSIAVLAALFLVLPMDEIVRFWRRQLGV